jgi:F0F1-type ATP synthase epsilon subunit
MKVVSAIDACFHPATGLDIPAAGGEFEVSPEHAQILSNLGMARVAPEDQALLDQMAMPTAAEAAPST